MDRLPSDSFEPFIYTWFALNAWAACVTGIDQDREWLGRLASDADLQQRFESLFDQDANFRDSVEHFTALWPIFKVGDIRRHHQQYYRPRTLGERDSLRDEMIAAGVTYEPADWAPNARFSWPQYLKTLARVRNNLFHGEKAAEDIVDQTVVHAALQTLVIFLQRTDFFLLNAETEASDVEFLG